MSALQNYIQAENIISSWIEHFGKFINDSLHKHTLTDFILLKLSFTLQDWEYTNQAKKSTDCVHFQLAIDP